MLRRCLENIGWRRRSRSGLVMISKYRYLGKEAGGRGAHRSHWRSARCLRCDLRSQIVGPTQGTTDVRLGPCISVSSLPTTHRKCMPPTRGLLVGGYRRLADRFTFGRDRRDVNVARVTQTLIINNRPAGQRQFGQVVGSQAGTIRPLRDSKLFTTAQFFCRLHTLSVFVRMTRSITPPDTSGIWRHIPR